MFLWRFSNTNRATESRKTSLDHSDQRPAGSFPPARPAFRSSPYTRTVMREGSARRSCTSSSLCFGRRFLCCCLGQGQTIPEPGAYFTSTWSNYQVYQQQAPRISRIPGIAGCSCYCCFFARSLTIEHCADVSRDMILRYYNGQVYDKGPSPYKSVRAAFHTIVKEEGTRALYQVGIFIFTAAATASFTRAVFQACSGASIPSTFGVA